MDRPLITFMLYAYKQERFIREAVYGAFSQTYSPLEIILSDDCSLDSTFEIMKEMAEAYKGPHQIILNRNEKNLGLVPHFNRLMECARGEIVVVAGGDDISLPERTEKSWKILSEHPDAALVSFSYSVIDTEGKQIGLEPPGTTIPILKRVTLDDYLFKRSGRHSGASRAFRKTLLDRFGPLNSRCPTEDTPIFFRGLMLGNAYLSSDCGIYYRVHGENISGSNRIHLLSYQQIFRQYMEDIRFGERKGMISAEQSQQMKRLAKTDFVRRRLAAELNFATSKPEYFVSHILCSASYSSREKIKIFCDVVRDLF